MSDILRLRLKIVIILILAELSSITCSFAQINQTAPTRQSSIDAFTKGNYEQAYNGFSQLLVKYPKDPLYKYYSGASLVMMKRDPEGAVILLQQSLNAASVVRSIPPEGLFYLGRAQQMSGKFTEAIISFNSYSDQVGKKKARQLNVQGYIQECENKKGIVAPGTSKAPGEADNTEKTLSAKPTDQLPVNNANNKTAGKESQVKTSLPTEYDNLLDDALKLQFKADSLNQLAEEQKSQMDKIPEAERSSLKLKISQNEMLASSYQKSADAKYNEAQIKMNPKFEVVPRKADSVPPVEIKEQVLNKVDERTSSSAIQTDTIHKEVAPPLKPVEIFSYFEILPKDAAYPDNKIIINPEVPAGLFYRIQLAVFKNPVSPSFFKGITPVYGFKVAGSENTNYYAGMFRRLTDAKKALLEVKEKGFRDAFIVALSDNSPVSLDRASMLENNWGNKSFISGKLPGAVKDTLPPELVFRVEVVRSKKPLKPDAVETLRTIASSRGLDILNLTDGSIVYLIGKFITFESAAEFSDLLVRNNYREAKVVAWLGNKEVPLDIARQLFNNVK